MPHDVLKMGPHDVGGEPEGKINTHDHGMTYWEAKGPCMAWPGPFLIVYSCREARRPTPFGRWIMEDG